MDSGYYGTWGIKFQWRNSILAPKFQTPIMAISSEEVSEHVIRN